MPYNLRKRKAPLEPVEQKVEVEKKPKSRAKKQKTIVDGEEPEAVELEAADEKPVIKRQKSTIKPKPTADEQLKKSTTKPKPAAKEQPKESTIELKPTVEDQPKKSTTKPKPAAKEQPKESTIELKPTVEEQPKKSTTKPKPAAKEQPIETTIEPKPIAEEQPKKLTVCNQLVFGSDTCGELGLKKIGCTKRNPTPVPLTERVKQVACGPMHTLSLTESGLIYSYGCNDEGALGRVTDGDDELESTPTIIELKNKVTKITSGDSHGAALTDKKEVFIWGNYRDEHGSVGLLPECEGKATFKPIQVMPNTEFKDIASGSNHMLLLDVDGVVYSFGVGEQGQLGRIQQEEFEKTKTADANQPAEVGLTDNENANQLEEQEKSTKITAEKRELFLTPKVVCLKSVDPQRPFVCDAIYAGNFSSFATNTDKKKNRLASWGLNNYYQLGYKGQQGQLVQYFPRRSTFTCSTSMINVACGQHHTIFLTRTGRVYAAGRHEYGMLGIGTSTNDKKEVCPAKQVEGFDSPVRTICAGINTSFAVSQKGKLYSWGMSGLNLGAESGDDADLIEPTLVNSLADKEVLSVSSGSSFTAVIVD